jgi:hypothetical protein
MTDIIALDLATVSGYARGRVGTAPSCGSIRFGKSSGGTNNAIFAAAHDWLTEYLNAPPIADVLIMEALLPPDAMRNHTSRQVRDRLAGLHGMARGIGHKAGIREISDVSVGAIRGHFIGDRGLYRDAAKRAVMAKCQQLGWPVTDHNAADAAACWSYAAAIIDPKHAIEVSPLFRRRAKA